MKKEHITSNAKMKTENVPANHNSGAKSSVDKSDSSTANSSVDKSNNLAVIIGCSVVGFVLVIIVVIYALVRRNRHGNPKDDNDGTSKGEVDGGISKQSNRRTGIPKTTTPTKTKRSAKETFRESQIEHENNRLRTHAPGSRVTGDIVYLNVEATNGEKANDANKNRAIPILNPYAA
ncbi:hypothetical protein PFISCL1PPCAC_4860 [Pristionchus fissidentatus]|uniref:Uncharacterized protein n=1 Tax=Pristionchus fissidentatus TaxID=1538716 RepID=A0AAV5V3A6_9BILA|nr:hypothetical protein PFISCL1PPCAC_4860 [Pristionchus fissidentatus]